MPTAAIWIKQRAVKHARYPNVFSLGDAGSSPNSKTGQRSASRPRWSSTTSGRPWTAEPSAVYDGYASCPLTTGRNRMLLAEFDYTMKPHPTIPVIDTKKERNDMRLLERYGLPFLYWDFILRGLA
jgi:sulfide:quinone oxidoreductase